MADEFVAPCVRHYGCVGGLEPYALDGGGLEFDRCRSCGLIWRDTVKCGTEQEYDKAYFERSGYEQRQEHRVAKGMMLMGMLGQFTQPGRLLEVGPAMGYGLEAAVLSGWQVEGIDISEYAVNWCCNQLNLNVEKGTLLDNKKAPGRFDAVLMKHVLEHYRDPFAALNAVHGLLADGGLAMVVVPNAGMLKAELRRGHYKFYNESGSGYNHFVYFNQATLRGALQHCSFEVLQKGYPLFVPSQNNPRPFLSRATRKILSGISMDQEIVAIARKKKQASK